jgi:hypothetical protein
MFGGGVRSETKPDSVKWPDGYDFRFAIRGEGYSLDEFCQWYLDKVVNWPVEDTYGLGLANLTLGLVKKEPYYLVIARSLFAADCQISKDPKEKRLSELSLKYVNNILSGKYAKAPHVDDTVHPIKIVRHGRGEKDFQKIIIGRSAIKVNKNAIIKVQADRVTRDWLQAYNIKGSPWILSIDSLTTWHEGQKIRELFDITGAKISIVTGTIARRFEEGWFAPDAEGVYRFELSADKVVHFPSAIVIDDRTAIINDTHGISAIAWDSLDADLAIGCGDAPGKMEAAYYLAESGVNVYVPTDRFIGTLIGTRTKGTIIGSAPVKKTADGAVIGDQVIVFDVNEPIVVSNSQAGYPLRYYDTALRYFKELEKYTGKSMNIIPVEVVEYGKAGAVVDEARRVGARLIGMRVKSRYEHDALSSWLKEDRRNRVVLFHTAVYPDGYKLFYEFPEQTSFGDIHPEFE